MFGVRVAAFISAVVYIESCVSVLGPAIPVDHTRRVFNVGFGLGGSLGAGTLLSTDCFL